MTDPQRLYVYETPKSVVTSWVIPDVSMTGRFRWLSNMYSHPEVVIFVGKSATVHRRKIGAINQAVMQALQAEHIAVSTLRYVKNRSVYTRKQKENKHKQENLF